MKTIHLRTIEKGQIIPILVVGLLVMIALAAVLVDGGSLLSNRRSAQAAADAAALAGARELCAGDTTTTRTAATTAALNYLNLNNAINEGITFHNVSINENQVLGINVKTYLTNSSFFAGILGQNNLKASAQATAGCYHPSITTHIMPIAFYYESPPVNADDADCDTDGSCDIVNWDYTELLDTLSSTASNNLPLDDIYIIATGVKVCEKPVTGPIVCSEMVSNPGGNRVWVDLSEIADTSNLKKLIKDGVDEPIGLPAWFNGQPGLNAAVYNDDNYSQLDPIEGYESLAARLFLVPVYDYFCTKGDPENDCPSEWHDGDSIEYIVNSNQPSYRLVGLAPFVVTGVTKNKKCVYGQENSNDFCPGYDTAYPTNDDKKHNVDAIEGYFVDGSPLDEFTSGTEGVSAGLDIISLTQDPD